MQCYNFIVLVHELTYFDKNETKGEKCYSENEVGVGVIKI